MKWSFVDGCGFAFGIVAIVPPLEMASPLEMLQIWVGCGASLRCCVVVVELIPTVDFRGPNLRLIAVVVLDDVGTMWVRVVF